MTQEVLPAIEQNPPGMALQHASEVTALLQSAIDQKVPVEFMERLLDLKERIDQRNARGAFFDAFAKFQEDCPPIPKTKTASFTTRKGGRFSYSYAPLEVITKHIGPYLAKHGFSYTWDVDLHPAGNALVVGCTLRHVEGHSERSTFPVPIDKGNDALSGAQQNGGALTYGKRQSLIMVAGLTTADEDVDAAKLDGEVSSSEVVTAEQASNLDDLIIESNADRGRFLRYFKIEKVSDLPASEYKRAVELLDERRRS